MDNLVLEKIKNLKEKIDYHNKKYYEDDDPEIEDWEYDSLKREYEFLCSAYPELLNEIYRIGGKASEKFSHVKHDVKMESLHDSFSFEEIEKFYYRVSNNNTELFVVEPKVDGVSLSVEYTNGTLTRASTRGDGIVGEDITDNALTIENLPNKISGKIKYLEVRGECYISKSDFEDLIKFQDANGQKVFKNPRNAAAGSIRQKDSGVCRLRRLKILFFNVQRISELKFDSHFKSLEFLKSLGLPVVESKLCSNLEEILSEVNRIGKNKQRYPFQADGAVIKIDSIFRRKSLGSTSSFPRWAEAFKYPPEVKRTKFREVEFSVGRTGIITPVGIFDEVNLGGSSISRASLHNEEFIKIKNIHIGDFVYVIKAGDIIPEIVKSESDPNDFPRNIVMPRNCPSCGSKLKVYYTTDNGRIFKCENLNCESVMQSKIVHFASRDAMNIETLGEKTVEILKNDIKKYSDIYKLDANILKKYKEFQSSIISADQELLFHIDSNIYLNKIGKNLLKSISQSKNNSLEKLIYAIGIPFVGKETAKILAKEFKSIENLINCSIDKLLNILGIGSITAREVRNFFDDEKNIKIIKELKKSNVNTLYKGIDEGKDNRSYKFMNLSFVITGKFKDYSRNEITKILESLGGKVNSKVTKNTSYLICGDSPGQKLKDAKKFGIKIIYEKELNIFLS